MYHLLFPTRLSTPRGPSLHPTQSRIVSAVRHMFGMSGGLSYHLSALRFKKLWTPFQKQVERWLNDWETPEAELIIFGTSGGYTLSEKFLTRFKRIIVLEPDPIARAILRRRFSKIKNWLMLDPTDLLPWFQSFELSPLVPNVDRSRQEVTAPLDLFLKRYPDAAILFSNLLGQVPLIWPRELGAAEWDTCNQSFLRSLEGRNWASYHDLLSGHDVPNLPDHEIPVWRDGESLSEVGARVWRGSKAVISDHGTDWLGARELSLWHLRPKTYHLIGFVTSRN